MATQSNGHGRPDTVQATVEVGPGPDKIVVWLEDSPGKGGVWMATYLGAEAARIRMLFGTDEIPTAFTWESSAEEVMGCLRRLNPNVKIERRNPT